MIIQKVINNNVVSTFDSNGKEVILMGKGIGFRKKTGDELDKTKIEKIFTLDLSGKSSFVQEVMAIIQEFYEIVLDTEHPAYQRFATHLQYLETEILSKKRPIEEDEEEMIKIIVEKVLKNNTITFNELRNDAIAMASCKMSIKANQILNEVEMNKVISDLYECKNPFTCPHGRPIITKMEKKDLEKMFKRIV